MGDAAIENATPFAFEPLVLADEDARPVLVPLVRATYAIEGAGLALAEEQVGACLAGEMWGPPETSSYRLEPEAILPKPATDVVLVASAVAPRPGTTEMMVGFQVGPLRKGVRVVGDRFFFRNVGTIAMTEPAAFERIPVRWERAFGGWDRSDPDERGHRFEPRNPVGVGFRAPRTQFEEGLRCPNVEDAARPFKGWGDRPPPAGLGFTSPGWEPRVKLGGTYDGSWQEERAPFLPRDFRREFLNGAPEGLVARGRLRGDEAVAVSGVAPSGGVSFRLPGLPPPRVSVDRAGARADVAMALDTVIVDTDASRVFLLWKGELALERDPHEIVAIEVRLAAGAAAPSPGERVRA